MSIIASQKEEDIMGGKSALLALHKALREIRGNIPKPTFNIKKAASSDIRIGYIGGKPKKRLVVTLRSSGCSWVESHGGCTMCGHYAGTTRGEKITEDHWKHPDYTGSITCEQAVWRNKNIKRK